MKRPPTDIGLTGALPPEDGRPYSADIAIDAALDAVENGVLDAYNFVEAMKFWNYGDWPKFQQMIEPEVKR